MSVVSSWEEFLEQSLIRYVAGARTQPGYAPTPSAGVARNLQHAYKILAQDPAFDPRRHYLKVNDPRWVWQTADFVFSRHPYGTLQNNSELLQRATSIRNRVGHNSAKCKEDFRQTAIHFLVGVHRCSCGYPPSPRGGPALWETLKVATFAIPQSHSVDCKAERVRPGRCGNDTPIVPSASWRRSKTVTRNGRRTSPRRRGTSRLTAGTSGVRCCASKTPVGISRLYLCAARRHTPEL